MRSSSSNRKRRRYDHDSRRSRSSDDDVDATNGNKRRRSHRQYSYRRNRSLSYDRGYARNRSNNNRRQVNGTDEREGHRRNRSHRGDHSPRRYHCRSRSIHRYSRNTSQQRTVKDKGDHGRRLKLYDDEEGHLVYHTGDWLNSQYQILDTLGTGTFGKVVLCHDSERRENVALKIIRNIRKYRDAAELEIRVLKKICKWDPKATKPCVRLLSWFDYYGHTCIGFNVLGLSSFDFLKNNNYTPYPMHHIQNMGYQLLDAVAFLHDNNLTHTDLKPENVLFVDSSYDVVFNEDSETSQRILKNSNICLIDFGSAVFKDEYHSRIVSTRHYRAPEVILELGWSYPCDMWSVGCILYEYYTGNALFQTHDNREHLAMMEIMLGKIPVDMQKNGKKPHYFDNYNQRVKWDDKGEDAKYVYDVCKPLVRYARGNDTTTAEFFKLLARMLRYDPNNRVTAREACNNRFFTRR